MFISPKYALDQGWVTFPEHMSEQDRAKCIQPNALDITIDRLFNVDITTPFVISEQAKTMRSVSEITPNDNKFWNLNIGCYDAMSDFHVDIPEGVAAYFITRSTFNRNGVFVQSGLYDQGFSNYAGFMLYNFGGVSSIAVGTRACQLIFVKSESSGIMYNGQYNSNKGQHWAGDPTKQ